MSTAPPTLDDCKVLIATLSVCTTAEGTEYQAAQMSGEEIIAFAGVSDEQGAATWNLYGPAVVRDAKSAAAADLRNRGQRRAWAMQQALQMAPHRTARGGADRPARAADGDPSPAARTQRRRGIGPPPPFRAPPRTPRLDTPTECALKRRGSIGVLRLVKSTGRSATRAASVLSVIAKLLTDGAELADMEARIAMLEAEGR